MDLGLKERAAIVGGSSRGMGKATALALAREGASVIAARLQGVVFHLALRLVEDMAVILLLIAYIFASWSRLVVSTELWCSPA